MAVTMRRTRRLWPSVWPVINEASFEHSHTTAPATSSGVPMGRNGHPRDHLFLDARVGPQELLDHRRARHAGANCIDPNSGPRELQSGRLGQPNNPMTRSRIRGRTLDAGQPRSGCRVDDGPSPRSSIWRSSYFMDSHVPFRLMLTVRSQFSSVQSAVAAMRPRPRRCCVCN